ncbi:MAG: hypothetical protein ACI9UT_003228 [Flavobacteriales bacterium]|jgi:hypothetical protein
MELGHQRPLETLQRSLIHFSFPVQCLKKGDDRRTDITSCRRLYRYVIQTRRLARVCSSARILAAGGALDNRRVTTHWVVCDLMSLALVEEDHGHDVAQWIIAHLTKDLSVARLAERSFARYFKHNPAPPYQGHT